MVVDYKINEAISSEQFTDLLKRSTLGERRPVDDAECMQGMISNSNLVITAWIGNNLVDISRCVTDFHYCCYLSDLAVDSSYQKDGIGRQLQIKTQEQLGPKCVLIFLAAPAANSYYEQVGYTNNERCWVLNRNEKINIP